MNWEMLAALGQLLAVFVGIPSLIYLAVQIREQTKERRQSAVNVLTVQWGDLTCALHDSARAQRNFSAQVVQSFADLDPVSNSGSARSSTPLFNHFEAMYCAHSEGLLDGIGMRVRSSGTMSDVIAYPGIQQWWKERKTLRTRKSSAAVVRRRLSPRR